MSDKVTKRGFVEVEGDEDGPDMKALAAALEAETGFEQLQPCLMVQTPDGATKAEIYGSLEHGYVEVTEMITLSPGDRIYTGFKPKGTNH